MLGLDVSHLTTATAQCVCITKCAVDMTFISLTTSHPVSASNWPEPAGKCLTTLWNLNEEDHSCRGTEEGSDEGSILTRSTCHGKMIFS